MPLILSLLLLFASAIQATAQSGYQTIVGGVDSQVGEFPFMASLEKFGNHHCGATLIRKNWILTGAHCLDMGPPSRIYVGMHDLRKKAEAENFGLKKFVIHPLYDPSGQRSLLNDYDFALIELDGSSIYPPVEISEQSVLAIDDLVTIGWGSNSEFSLGTIDILQKVSIPFVSPEKCSIAYPQKITDRMLCAGFDEGGKDSCNRDSGGPLLVNHKGQEQLVGVTSWGDGCARKGKFGVYSKVNSVADWIESTIAGAR